MRTYLKIVGLFFCVMSVKVASAQEASLKITDNFNRTTKHEVATETISATNVVSGESKVHYEAGKSVTLLPGFSAKSGSTFKANIAKIESSSKIAGAETSENVSMYAYPNPFEAFVEIQYYLPKAGKVSLSITNIVGMNIATLLDNQDVSEGNHTVKYSGDGISSGSYLYTLKTETGAISKKLSKK
ncbi:MAG: T9SS type A sorting domain-containing protein [Bacteroidota bacterium]